MSTKYKCLLADDSMLDRDALEMHLSKIENLYIEAVCSSGLEAAAILKEKNIDIVFSDIDMPDLSGLELIQSLPNPPVFIFISSYSEHAAESYSLDVIDFIVKPASLARLMKAANKAIEYIELKKTAANEQVESNSVPQGNSDFFYIKEDNGYARVNTSDLLYVESMGNFSRLQLLNQKKHLTLYLWVRESLLIPADSISSLQVRWRR